MTVVNRNQFDISKPTDYLNRKMFLDEAGPVTLQRFEEVKYPKIDEFEKLARAYFWIPEEVDLTKDKADMKEATEAIAHMFTSNVLRQTTLDSEQGKTPAQIFSPCVSLPEMEALMYVWTFFETNIHSRSYSHIIQNIYNVPKTVFETVHETKHIVDMASSVGEHYNAVHRLNCRAEVHANYPHLTELAVNVYEHKKAIWFAMHASYALEAIRFMVSFATSLAMMENKIFIGNGNIICLILQDELLHAQWTAYILKTMVKDDPDFAKIKEETTEEVYKIYEDVIAEEKNWAKYLCSKGPVIGLNERILSSFVDYTAKEVLAEIGIKYRGGYPKSHPIPWFLKHKNIDMKQTALQESESVSYVLNAMTDTIDYSELPDL